jgi:hypothetical protein
MSRAREETQCLGWLRNEPQTPTTPKNNDPMAILDRALAEAERRDSARSSITSSSSGRGSTPRVAATPPWDAPETPVASSQAPGSLLTGVNLALEAFALESPSPVRPQAAQPPTPDRGLRDRTNTPPRRAHFAPRPKRKRVPVPAL